MDFTFLSKSALFAGTSPDEVETMLHCLGAVQRSYSKGAFLFHVGDTTRSLGLVLTGSVHIESIDLLGNKSLLGHVSPGQIFAETYACIPNEPMLVNVTASESCDILFLDVGRILKTCPNACPHHNRIVQNLLFVTAMKNLNLSQRILHTAPKSIRGRVISYLSDQAARQGGYAFTIPFNRQQLAEYLGVDRSALSGELSKMQKDGILTVRKNTFRICKDEPFQ